MSPRLKRLSGRDAVRILTAVGFDVIDTRGSHLKLRRIASGHTRQTLTVPLHDELAPGGLLAIYRQALRFIAAGDLRLHFFNQ